MKSKDKYEIETTLEAYFDGIEHDVSINMEGSICNLLLWYKDFKSPRIVRRDLEELIPNLNNIDITRDYSEKSSCMALYNIISKHPVMYIKAGCGYIDVRLPEMINDELFDKDI